MGSGQTLSNSYFKDTEIGDLSAEQKALLARIDKSHIDGNLMKGTGETVEAFILDFGHLRALFEDVVRQNLGEGVDAAIKLGARRKAKDWVAPLEGYIGRVDESTWRRIIKSAIDGLRNDIKLPQYNGQWELAGATLGTQKKPVSRHKKHASTGEEITYDELVQYMVVTFDYIDASNNRELKYDEHGNVVGPAPSVAGLDPRIAETLQQMATEKNKADIRADNAEQETLRAENAELRAKVDSAQSQMDRMEAMVASLMAAKQPPVEVVAPVAPPKVSRDAVKSAITEAMVDADPTLVEVAFKAAGIPEGTDIGKTKLKTAKLVVLRDTLVGE
jgi:hypothetical protein